MKAFDGNETSTMANEIVMVENKMGIFFRPKLVDGSLLVKMAMGSFQR